MKNDNFAGKAYDYLYKAIISHRLKPGSPIVEQDISRNLGISRTPVREALKLLESEGLVRHIPSKGTFVSEVTLQDIEEIFFLRELLELGALQLAWDRFTPLELDRLEQELLSLSKDSPADAYYKADRALHHMIVRFSGNKRMMSFLNRINAQVERLRHIAAFNPQRPEKSRYEHLAIISALKAKDYEASKESLCQHIHNVKENTMEVYRKYLLS